MLDHYLAVNQWQAANQSGGQPLKEALKDPVKAASLAAIHDRFERSLTAELTPDQVEKVKDELTVNKVEVTFKAYDQIVPNLTEVERAHMLVLLKQAREEAIDAGSMEEKSSILQSIQGQDKHLFNGRRT